MKHGRVSLFAAGLDHWTGPLDWTTGLDWTDLLRFARTYIMEELSAFLRLKQVQRLQTTAMPTWGTAIMHTSNCKWLAREKHFTPDVVSVN